MDLAHEERLTAVEARSKSNTRRIDKLERSTEAISRIATSVEVMATKQDNMAAKQDDLAGTLKDLDDKVENLEAKPAKRWESVTEKVILVVVGGIVGAILMRLGL